MATTAKRQATIDAINKRLKPPTESELRSLKEKGAESWGEYICEMAANCGVSVGNAFQLFNMLGEDEAFDGFVTHMEDNEGMDEE